MLTVILVLVALAGPAFAVITSGLYQVSSKFFLQDAISHDGTNVGLRPVVSGTVEQVWSVILTNKTATIQNLGTGAFLSLDANGTVVPSVKPHHWAINAYTPSGAGIVSNGKAVGTSIDSSSLELYKTAKTENQLWEFIPVVPPPHAYRIWNQATNLYLDPQGDCDTEDPCFQATPFDASSNSQIWRVAGTSCGGRPTLENTIRAPGDRYLASGENWTTHIGTQAFLNPNPYPWAYGFVGGQLTLHDRDDTGITTLTVFERQWIDLSSSSEGPGTAPEQTWVFVPVY